MFLLYVLILAVFYGVRKSFLSKLIRSLFLQRYNKFSLSVQTLDLVLTHKGFKTQLNKIHRKMTIIIQNIYYIYINNLFLFCSPPRFAVMVFVLLGVTNNIHIAHQSCLCWEWRLHSWNHVAYPGCPWKTLSNIKRNKTILMPTERTRINESKTSTFFRPSFMFLHDQVMTRLSGWLGFLLLISMCNDVAEGLVVNVASWVDGSDGEGLIHLHSKTQWPSSEKESHVDLIQIRNQPLLL